MENANSPEYLEKIRNQVIENLKRTAFAPSVQMTDVPREPLMPGMDEETERALDDQDEDENKDTRTTKRRFDKYIEKDGELSDSEDEEEAAAIGVRRQGYGRKRRNQVDYRNFDGESGIDSFAATPREGTAAPETGRDVDEKMGSVQIEAMQTEPPTRPESTIPDAEPSSETAVEKDKTEPPAATNGDGPADTTMTDAPAERIQSETPAVPEGPSDISHQESTEEVRQRPGPDMTPPQEPEDTAQGAGNEGTNTDVATAPAAAGAAAPTTDKPNASNE